MADDIRVAAFIHAKPGQEDAVRRAALACVPPTRAEPGNTEYVLHGDAKDPSLFVFIEAWTSQRALDEHLETAHVKALSAALEGRLARPVVLHVLTPA